MPSTSNYIKTTNYTGYNADPKEYTSA